MNKEIIGDDYPTYEESVNLTLKEREQPSDIIWCVSVETKHGVDTILIRQEKEPCDSELQDIKNVFMHNFDMEEDELHVSTECGMRHISELPTSVEAYVRSEKA